MNPKALMEDLFGYKYYPEEDDTPRRKIDPIEFWRIAGEELPQELFDALMLRYTPDGERRKFQEIADASLVSNAVMRGRVAKALRMMRRPAKVKRYSL